jgi:hypothetical protein
VSCFSVAHCRAFLFLRRGIICLGEYFFLEFCFFSLLVDL